MRAGQLRHRIELQRPTLDDPDHYGQQRVEWVKVASDSVGGLWWAEVAPVAGGEVESGGQTQASVTHQIRMRHVPGLNVLPSWRAIYQARTFGFVSAVPDERNKELAIQATEMVAHYPNQ